MKADNTKQKQLKYALLFAGGSNFGMWIIEIITALLSGSSSLLADALDFLFDGSNYFSSVYALNKSENLKTLFWKIKWYIMVLTGIAIFIWIAYKWKIWWIPEGSTMTIIGLMALLVNIISASILRKYQDESLDIRAVWLCTRNDAINNILVIIAGFLTLRYGSIYPDIVASTWMASMSIWGGTSILQWWKSKTCCHH